MKTKVTYLFYTAMLLFCLTVKAQNSNWITTSSVVSFKIKNAGFNVSGKFSGLTSKIVFDASKNSGNAIEAALDVKTISTDNSTRDGHLKKEEYFDAEKFPFITMRSQTFLKQNDGSFKGFFKLQLKNTSKDVVVPFTFTEKEGKGVFKGSFTINRLNYGVGSSSIILSDNVTINLTIYVVKK